ncbi:MAG: hypothetical protein ACYS8W_19780, partial [Planctomycetota bacterium]
MRFQISTLLAIAAAVLFAGCQESQPVGPRLRIVDVTQATDFSGAVTVTYLLSHKDSKLGAMYVDYTVDSGLTWQNASAGNGSDTLTALAAHHNGSWHTFVWDAGADLACTSFTARLRFLPYIFSKDKIKFGAPVETSDLKVRNYTMTALGCVSILAAAGASTDTLNPALCMLQNGSVIAAWESRNATDSTVKFSSAPPDSNLFANAVDINPAQSSPADEAEPDIAADIGGALYACWTEPASGFRRLKATYSIDNG